MGPPLSGGTKDSICFFPYEVRVGHRRDRCVPPECVLVHREKAMGGPTCPWEPVEKSSSNTPVATRISTNLPSLLHHSLFFLSLSSSFHFFLYSYQAFSHLSQRKDFTGVLIDFHSSVEISRVGWLEEKSLYDDVNDI